MARRRRRRNLRAAGATRLSICIGRRTWERTCSYAEACRPTVERVRAITTALFLRVFIHNPVQDCVRFAALQLVLHPDSFRSSNQQLHWPPCKLLHCAHGLLYCEFPLYCDVMHTLHLHVRLQHRQRGDRRLLGGDRAQAAVGRALRQIQRVGRR